MAAATKTFILINLLQWGVFSSKECNRLMPCRR
jgi:hypothetical protein